MDNLKQKLANELLEIGAVYMDANQPFTLTSGKKSPLYIDVRKLITNPIPRDEILSASVDILKENIENFKDMTIAGGESAGIPFSSIISHIAKLPLVYIRKQPKKFGLEKYIEGNFSPNKQVLLVEDILTNGESKIKFVNHIKNEGGVVKNIFVPITYQDEEQEEKFEKENNIKVHSIIRLKELIEIAEQKQIFSQSNINACKEWLLNNKNS